MVVGGRDPGGRDFHEQLRVAGARPRAGARGCAGHVARPRTRASGKRRRWRSRCARCCSGLFLGKRISRFRPATPSNSLALEALSSALWPILGGAVLAILLGRWGHRLARVPLLRDKSSSRRSARPDARPLPWAGWSSGSMACSDNGRRPVSACWRWRSCSVRRCWRPRDMLNGVEIGTHEDTSHQSAPRTIRPRQFRGLKEVWPRSEPPRPLRSSSTRCATAARTSSRAGLLRALHLIEREHEILLLPELYGSRSSD